MTLCISCALFDILMFAITEVFVFVIQVILYENELAGNGVSLLTVKVVNVEFRQVLFTMACNLYNVRMEDN